MSGLRSEKILPAWSAECHRQPLSPRSSECLEATQVHDHLYLRSLDPNHRRNSKDLRARVLTPFPRGVRCQTALPHLKTPAPQTRYHHSKADPMNQVSPTAGQVTREVEGVWICDGRFGGGSGTKSVRRRLEADFVCRFLASHTWTSFSPSETRFTILVRAALSGFAFRWYSDSSTA